MSEQFDIEYRLMPAEEQPSPAHRIGFRIKLDDDRSVMVARVNVKRTGGDGKVYVEPDVTFIEFVSAGGETTRLVISQEAAEALHDLTQPDGYGGECVPEWVDLNAHVETASYGPGPKSRSDVCPATQEAEQKAEAGNLSGGGRPVPEVPHEDHPGADG